MPFSRILRAVSWVLAPGVLACSSRAAEPDTAPVTPEESRRPALCARPGDDAVRDVFCAAAPPRIGSLADLHGALQVAPVGPGSPTYVEGDHYPAPGIFQTGGLAVTLGHSTSLSGRVVSSINPRVIVPGGSHSLLAFQRGVQKVEIATVLRDGDGFQFYLVTFRQACSDSATGCSPGDLYTPSVETGWRDVALQDADDLANTPSDCRQCHQRAGGPGTLLMRELEAPWTHFFAPDDELNGPLVDWIDNALLARSYHRAKGDESYGGVGSEALVRTSGFLLQPAVPQDQPLLFDSPTVFNERFPFTEGKDWPQPPVRSATWDREFEAFKRGEHLPLPHYDLMVTDPEKLERAALAYQNFRAGTLDASELPDLADVFPDDPRSRAEIGLETEPGATPVEALIQACGGCHNDVLDQSLSRARFNVGLSRLSRDELAVAVDRLGRGRDEPGAMPPAEARQLTPQVRARLIDYLRNAKFSPADLDALDHAAVIGMAGNTTPAPRAP